MISTEAICSICNVSQCFRSPDDFWSCRDALVTSTCPMNGCVTRERALATALFGLFDRQAISDYLIHEAAPSGRGLSVWLSRNCRKYTGSGYFPESPLGSLVGGLRNEDLESQTFPDESLDIVIHADVLEHLFEPFKALNEIYRTLKPGGTCVFAAPTEGARFESLQVAFRGESGDVRIVGTPEYHGNPQSDVGSLVTWKYGYDLPLLITRMTPFDVEVRRWQDKSVAVMGTMTEVYILRKNNGV